MAPIQPTRSEKKTGGDWQAARINKNLIVNGDLARVVLARLGSSRLVKEVAVYAVLAGAGLVR